MEEIWQMNMEDMFINFIATADVRKRGKEYYRKGAVKEFRHTGNGCYEAVVQGSDLYHVRIEESKFSFQPDYECDCPAYYKYSGPCKHVIAVICAMKDEKERLNEKLRRRHIFELFDNVVEKPINAVAETILEPTCVVESYGLDIKVMLQFRIGTRRLYVMKSIIEFLDAMRERTDLKYGKDFTLQTSQVKFSPVSERLYEMLIDAERDEKSIQQDARDNRMFNQKSFMLTYSYWQRFLKIIGDEPFRFSYNGEINDGAVIVEGRPQVEFILKSYRGIGTMTFKNFSIKPLDEHCHYLLDTENGGIYHVDEEFSRIMMPVLHCFAESKDGSLKINKEDISRFLGQIVPQLEKVADVSITDKILNEYKVMPLESEIYFDRKGDGISAMVRFQYGELRYNPFAENEQAELNDEKLVHDINSERKIKELFAIYGFKPENGLLVQEDEDKSYDFLVCAVPELVEMSAVYYADGFKNNKPVRSINNIGAGIKVGENRMLELTLDLQTINVKELLDMVTSYQLKKRYHRLKDGTFITLEDEQFEGLAEFAEIADLKHAKRQGNTIKIPWSKAVYLDSLVRDTEAVHLKRSSEFKKMVAEIKEPADIDTEIPAALEPILRDYQKTGFKWLTTLAHYHLGGILADDMGLGKTLQVITFLLAEKDNAKCPSLVVAPTSLIYNWQDEVQRFAPELKVLIVSGTKNEREQQLEAAADFDLIVTTYNMLKRDIELYEDASFQYCFLDEAQHIKNPNTQNARAVKRLQTQGYFALTGTPIENTLTELWSIFDYLMPGYLMTQNAFRKKFELPIVKADSKQAARELNRYIAPFILRRLKKDVLQELPDKVEKKLVNEMTAQQTRLYNAYLIQAQKEFETELKLHGLENSRIKVLAILTRMRQICCHPATFLDDYQGGSGKLEMLRELVSDTLEGGHRILIFSQFTKMLALIREMLSNMEVAFSYLDGGTPAMERMRLVKEFNAQQSKKVFLISLKAGGTGLNLTGADVVIHFDPWWNPAVEDQATDRAYRLGQQRNVQVFKLITKDTIEEKIYKLQERKKALIDKMIQPGESFLTKLSEEDLRDLFKR